MSRPVAAVGDEQARDRLLRHARAGDDERVLGSLVDELLRDERVGDEHVARADELEPAGGDQARVAGAGADEVDGHSELLGDEAGEVRLALLVGGEVRLRPRPQLAQAVRQLGVLRPHDGRDLVAQMLRERG